MDREKEIELSPTPLNPLVGIEINIGESQKETIEVTDKNENE